MSALIELLLEALGVYRLTRLVTKDTITQPIRARIVRFAYQLRDGETERDIPLAAWDRMVEDDDDPPKLAVLVTCRWCAGFWIAMLAVIARAVAPKAWQRVATVMTLSAAAALIAGLEDDD